MYIFRSLFLSLLLFGGSPLCPEAAQTVALTGTVSDNVTGGPVDGADVILYDASIPPKELTRGVTGINGKYQILNLKVGEHIRIYYRRGGYLPSPGGPVNHLLVKGANVEDFQLTEDSQQAAYWTTWAQKVRARVDSSTSDPRRRTALYDQFWSDLGISGFSPVSQVLAAHSLTEATPGVSHSGHVSSFASVDPGTLGEAYNNITAAVDGQAKLRKYAIPPDVATAIAAAELKKRHETAPPPEFMDKFGVIWGEGAKGDLTKAIADAPKKDEDYRRALEHMHLTEKATPMS